MNTESCQDVPSLLFGFGYNVSCYFRCLYELQLLAGILWIPNFYFFYMIKLILLIFFCGEIDTFERYVNIKDAPILLTMDMQTFPNQTLLPK